jgi:hypothetical protein
MPMSSLLRTLLAVILLSGSATSLAGKQSTDITDADVQKFAAAHEEVMKVRQEYVGKAKSAEGQEKKKQLQMAMQKDMLKAVQESGMKPKRYNKVARAVGQDEDLRKRVEKALQQ